MMHLANLRSFLLKLGYSYCRTLSLMIKIRSLRLARNLKKKINLYYLFVQSVICQSKDVVRTRKGNFSVSLYAVL